jgi:hypothetical protein
MEEEKQKIIDRIQKCLLLAKDQDGTPEGEVAKKTAAMLMAKYRIHETEVDLETDNFIMDTFEYWNDGAKRPQWPGSIVSTFCHVFDCKTVFREYPDRTEWEIIGTFSDVETTVYFIDVVSAHIEKKAKEQFPQKSFSGKRNQFGNVAAIVIWERAWELKKQMDTTIHEDEGCTSLVIQKTKEVKEAVEELYPNMKKRKGKKKDLPDDKKTWEAGRKAGESAPLNFAIEEA